ncbi:putative DNA-binding transcriptional dual regulator [Salinisphaera sp. S4-8]|uniref:LysR family transcriptional regulator n=1 Tax=Salinisphaera sp. S4-8 TaxID=633357 RepID=UPI003342145C
MQVRGLPPIQSLDAFISVVRLGSLAAASEELHLSVPALSRRIARLEADLGISLFERRPRGLVLTPAGESYHAKIVPALKLLHVAHAGISKERRHIVRLTTIPAFANRWLLPRLHRFSAMHPEIEVDIIASTSLERLDDQDLDLAIRLARDDAMPEPPLLPIHVSPVWGPARIQGPSVPSDVLKHVLLDPDHRPEFWREWLAAYRLDPHVVQMRPVDPLVLYELTASGAGVGIGLDPLVSDLVDQGRLATMSAYRVRSSRSFHLVQKPDSGLAPRRLAAWLQEEAVSRSRPSQSN